MSGYKRFAVAGGTGDVGRFIVNELLKQRPTGLVSEVLVLTRNAAGHDELKAKGATVNAVDYNDHPSLVTALEGVDVVISALAAPGLMLQIPLADAAKEAGVKLFLLSEYGLNTIGKTHGIFGKKNEVKQHVVDIGLPYAQFFTGLLSDWFFVEHPEVGFDFKNGKAVVRGSGDVPVTWTDSTDAARYIVHVLTHLPPKELENQYFAIESERKTINEILNEYQFHTGRKLEVTYISTPELEKQVKEHANEPSGRIGSIFLELERGEGLTGTAEEVNRHWPEFKPTKILDTILNGQAN